MGHGNAAGASDVLAWQTGYAFGVNLSREYPRWNPGEFTAEALLRRSEVDLVLQVGQARAGDLSREAVRTLARLPRVLIGHDPVASPMVAIPTAVAGIDSSATLYRLDGVPLAARALVDSGRPSDAEVLAALLTRVRARRGRADAGDHRSPGAHG